MASSFKSTKTELVAIYRLEFYKKKKNWKLGQNVAKLPDLEPESKPSSESRVALNQTYNIEVETKPDGTSQFNNAFLESESEPSSPQDQVIQPFEQGQYIPEPIWLEPEKPWVDAPPAWPMDEPLVLSVDEPDGPQGEVKIDVEVGEECYSASSRMWSASPHSWTGEPQDAPWAAGDAVASVWTPEVALSAADRWLLADANDRSAFKERASCSLESASAFMRGAAAAPHSSEVDLCQHSVSSEAGCSGSILSGLSTRRLAASVRRHADALRHLLLEARAREQTAVDSLSLYYQNALTADSTLEYFPTRDTGPMHHSRPQTPHTRTQTSLSREATYTKDSFIAGSFKNTGSFEEVTGRGRGRLRRNVIGIGMGRPYRL